MNQAVFAQRGGRTSRPQAKQKPPVVLLVPPELGGRPLSCSTHPITSGVDTHTHENSSPSRANSSKEKGPRAAEPCRSAPFPEEGRREEADTPITAAWCCWCPRGRRAFGSQSPSACVVENASFVSAQQKNARIFPPPLPLSGRTGPGAWRRTKASQPLVDQTLCARSLLEILQFYPRGRP